MWSLLIGLLILITTSFERKYFFLVRFLHFFFLFFLSKPLNVIRYKHNIVFGVAHSIQIPIVSHFPHFLPLTALLTLITPAVGPT